MTTWVTFVPSMLWIFAGAPFVERLRANRQLSGALAAITAAVVGVILNLSVWFALHVLFGKVTEMHAGPLRWYAFDPLALDLRATALAAIAAVLAFGLHRSLIEVVVAMAALGVLVQLVLGSLAFAIDRALMPAAQRKMRDRRQREEDRDAGKRQQKQRRKHARDVELDNRIRQCGRPVPSPHRLSLQRSRQPPRRSATGRRRCAGPPVFAAALMAISNSTAPASATPCRARKAREDCDRPNSTRASYWREPERTRRSMRRRARPGLRQIDQQ